MLNSNQQIVVPNGWFIYINCVKPKTLYVGTQKHIDLAKRNGLDPVIISSNRALGLLKSNDEYGCWSLEFLSSIVENYINNFRDIFCRSGTINDGTAELIGDEEIPIYHYREE